MNTLSNLWWITGLDFFSNFGDAIFDRDANPNDRGGIKKMILLIMEIWKWKSKYESKEKNQAEKT